MSSSIHVITVVSRQLLRQTAYQMSPLSPVGSSYLLHHMPQQPGPEGICLPSLWCSDVGSGCDVTGEGNCGSFLYKSSTSQLWGTQQAEAGGSGIPASKTVSQRSKGPKPRRSHGCSSPHGQALLILGLFTSAITRKEIRHPKILPEARRGCCH